MIAPKPHRAAVTGVVLAFVLSLIGAPGTLLAWSYKEHILFTRLAVLRLLEDPATPAEMKAWLGQAAGELPNLEQNQHFFMTRRVGRIPVGYTDMIYWACVPDIEAENRAAAEVEPFKVKERMLHFIDLELLWPDQSRRRYRHDLSNKPLLQDIPRNIDDPRLVQAGMLPHRVEQCYRELVAAIRAGRLHAPAADLQQKYQTATYWAGYLSHYLADNTQPHHATVDYKSQSYFANPAKAPNIHAEMEYRMCDDEHEPFTDLRQEYWQMLLRQLREFEDPIQTEDPFQATVEVSLRSYDALPLIGLAAMSAAGQAGTPDHPTGQISGTFDTRAFFRFTGPYMGRQMSVLEMKAIQSAWAVKRIQRVLRQAWVEAHN
ncbi:MAG TPA: hypothetical protein VNL70_06440 [Tepidisphaeraceae bacterium]|nr:hypothetical protein [Tepidisphaeraceae bacterium]